MIASAAPMRVLFGLLLTVVLAAGCASVKTVSTVKADHAERDLPAVELLDMTIVAFDPGVPDTIQEQKEQNVYPAIRQAEASYIPYRLREVLQGTGYWGAVRVLPQANPGTDLTVTGKIIKSDGEKLNLRIQAVDASGRLWFDRNYEETAAEFAYTEKLPAGVDPFQDVYNRIANDLLAERRKLSAAQLQEVKRVANLRFAADLAPQRFGVYLDADEVGRYSVKRLPPENDPLLARVAAIRARDEMLVDVLDQHYATFQSKMRPSYQEWRKSSYREIVALRELKQSEFWRKIVGAAAIVGGIALATQSNSNGSADLSQLSVIGGAYLFKTGMDKSEEQKIHVEAIRELSNSLESEVKPQTVELEGKTVTLTGSAKAQYQQWRQLLREMYVVETGLSDGAGVPARPQ